MGVLTLLLGLAAVQAAALHGKEEMSENPIRRIVNLLQMMAKEIEEDGEKDEEMHEKYASINQICVSVWHGALLDRDVSTE